MEKIILTSDDGEDLEFFVLEETQLSGIRYILVWDTQEGVGDACILKMVSEDGDDAIYEIVDDDTEFSAVAKLFEELVGDEADFEM